MTLPALLTTVRRPVVLAALVALCLTALLGAGLVVARAVEGSSSSEPAGTTASPSTSSEESGTAGNGDDNTAVAVNTRDGSSVYAVRLKVVLVSGDTVDSQNAAVAAASCADCQTVAIALEGVLITGDAETISPENVAIAINEGCSGCQTLAYAYQNVQTTDGKVRLTGAGRKRIAELRSELNGLRTSGLDILAVKQRVDEVAAAFADVLATAVVPIGRSSASPTPTPTPTSTPIPTQTSLTPADSASPTSSPTAAVSASPEASRSPSPTATPSGSATPSPSASATPTG